MRSLHTFIAVDVRYGEVAEQDGVLYTGQDLPMAPSQQNDVREQHQPDLNREREQSGN